MAGKIQKRGVFLFSDIVDEAATGKVDPIFELAEQLLVLRNEKENIEGRLAKVKATLEEIGDKLADAMLNKETQNFTRAGKMFYLKTNTHASAKGGAKQELFDALKKNGYGDLVCETVHANSLTAFVKEMRGKSGDELPGWLDGLVNVYEKTEVGVRNAPKK